MEWNDLSLVSKNILEQCWGLFDDKPKTFTVEFGKLLYKHPVERKHYDEISSYIVNNSHVHAELLDDGIMVKGLCDFGSWLNKK